MHRLNTDTLKVIEIPKYFRANFSSTSVDVTNTVSCVPQEIIVNERDPHFYFRACHILPLCEGLVDIPSVRLPCCWLQYFHRPLVFLWKNTGARIIAPLVDW